MKRLNIANVDGVGVYSKGKAVFVNSNEILYYIEKGEASKIVFDGGKTSLLVFGKADILSRELEGQQLNFATADNTGVYSKGTSLYVISSKVLYCVDCGDATRIVFNDGKTSLMVFGKAEVLSKDFDT